MFIDAGVHLFLAPGYQGASPGTISQGNLFLLEAAAAVLVGIWVRVRPSRAAWAAALLVSFSAFAAVMLYRYVDIPAFGPFPAMYDPVWFFSKTLSAVAEGAGTVLAIVGLARGTSRRSAGRRTGQAGPAGPAPAGPDI